MSDIKSSEFKFPTGEFTHTELALFNNRTNQQVWVRYQQAIKDGVIVSAGERKTAGSKGKPSKLWKINPSYNVVIAPTTPAVVAPSVLPSLVVVVPTDVVTTTPPTTAVAETPTSSEEPVVVEDKPVKSEEDSTTIIVPVVNVDSQLKPSTSADIKPVRNIITSGAETLTTTCPICGNPLHSMKDATGYMVWCGQPIEVCKSTENPFGHANTIKAAIEILNDKFSTAALQ